MPSACMDGFRHYLTKWRPHVCMYICLCVCIYTHTPHVYPLICWWTLRLLTHLGYSTSKNIGGALSFWIRVFIFSGYMPRSEIAVACVPEKLLHLCPTPCNLMDCSTLGSSVHEILQARILELVAILSCRGSLGPRDQSPVSLISYIGRWVVYI